MREGKGEIFFKFLVILLIFLNIVLLVWFLHKRAGIKERITPASPDFLKSSFYDTPCPALSLVDIAGNRINLQDFQGQVILLYFSHFYASEVPLLIFLNHLWEKFRLDGLRLFVVFPSEIIDLDYIFRNNQWTFPIVKGSGQIAAPFGAKPGTVVIIDRNFKIKFNLANPPKDTIYRQVRRYLDIEASSPPSLENLASYLLDLYFIDMITKDMINLGQQIVERPAIIVLCLSPCFSCPEARKISMLREVATPFQDKKAVVFFLFARGYNFNLIEEFALRNKLSGTNLRVGIICCDGGLLEKRYLDLFEFEVDPRLFIFNQEGKLIFAETKDNQRYLQPEFILEKIR